MTGSRDGDVARARVNHDVDHRDELSGRDLADDDVVGRLQEIARLGVLTRERTEDELRHCHVGGSLDPVSGDIPERHGEPAVRQLHEVVHVTPDLDARRRFVRCAELEPLQAGNRLR